MAEVVDVDVGGVVAAETASVDVLTGVVATAGAAAAGAAVAAGIVVGGAAFAATTGRGSVDAAHLLSDHTDQTFAELLIYIFPAYQSTRVAVPVELVVWPALKTTPLLRAQTAPDESLIAVAGGIAVPLTDAGCCVLSTLVAEPATLPSFVEPPPPPPQAASERQSADMPINFRSTNIIKFSVV